MTDFEPETEDITALREQDDLRAFMRSRIRRTRQPAQRAPAPVWHPPGHRPGQWPAGTRPPDPPPPMPPGAWETALAEYRAWNGPRIAAGRPDDNTPRRCECGACPKETR